MRHCLSKGSSAVGHPVVIMECICCYVVCLHLPSVVIFGMTKTVKVRSMMTAAGI